MYICIIYIYIYDYTCTYVHMYLVTFTVDTHPTRLAHLVLHEKIRTFEVSN